MQQKLELSGYSSPAWRLQRALQGIFGATCLQGESAITAPPFFRHRQRERITIASGKDGGSEVISKRKSVHVRRGA